jgi:hypothetical protein
MNAPVDFNALKTRQQTAWASGNYAVIGTTLQLVGELLAEACDLRCDAALPADKAQVREQDLVALLNEMNTAGAGSLVVPSAYLEVVVTRR